MVEPQDEKTEDGPSFETVLERLGPLGKFKLIHVVLSNLAMIPLSMVVLSFVFQGFEPCHVCNAVNETKLLSKYGLENDATAEVVYESCQIKVLANRTGQMDEVDTMDCPNGRNFFDAKHTTILSEWDLVCESSGVAEVSQMIFNIGQMVGGFIGSYLCDRFGRKPFLLASTLGLSIVELSIAAAPSIFFIYAFKLMSGMCYQTCSSCFFIYSLEYVTPRHREVHGFFMSILWVVLTLMIGAIAFVLRNDSWRYYQGALGIMGLIFLAYPFVLSESPRWLAATGRFTDALLVLEKASKMNGKDFQDVKETFMEFANHSSRQKHCSSRRMFECGSEKLDDGVTFKERERERERIEKEKKPNVSNLLRNTSLRKLTLIVWYFFLTNNLTYMGLYMTSSNLAGNRFLNFTAITIVDIPGSCCMFYMIKKMNRRLVFKISLILTSASIMTSTILDTFAEDLEGSVVASTMLFILGKLAINCCYCVLFIVAPELFPTNLRAIATGFCLGMARPGAMLAPFLRPLYQVVKWAPGLIFTVMCLVAAFLTFFLPETKDADLPDDIDDVMELERKTGSGNQKNVSTAE